MKLILTVVIAAFTFGFVECEFPCGKELNACTNSTGETSIPWQAYTIRSYSINRKWYTVTCNAVILNTKHVLSIQYCLSKYDSTDRISVHVGDGTKISVENVYINNNLTPIKITIARIQGNMTFTNQMYAVCLPSQSISLEQHHLYGNIWGSQGVHEKKGIYTNIDKSSQECKNSTLERPPHDDEKCIHRIQGKFDFKDIGTPFIMNHNSRCTLVGILSKVEEFETSFMLDLVKLA